MTPFELDMMIHFYAIREHHPSEFIELGRETIKDFIKRGLIYQDGEFYKTTVYGDWFVERLMGTNTLL